MLAPAMLDSDTLRLPGFFKSLPKLQMSSAAATARWRVSRDRPVVTSVQPADSRKDTRLSAGRNESQASLFLVWVVAALSATLSAVLSVLCASRTMLRNQCR